MPAEDPPDPKDQYRDLRPAYEGFAAKVGNLLKELLEHNRIKFHVVEARAKELASFSEKISRPGKHYLDPINEITDLCGCRIILYYQDDIKSVSDCLKDEFDIVEENLSRQPSSLEVDRFGYLSAHYIVKIKKQRADLFDWKPYSLFCAEIQVRTVFQHAWSAVSHTVLYKQEAGIPSHLQRRLHRIASLFELADEEFVALRNIKESLLSEAKADIKKGDVSVPISAASISAFIDNWAGKGKILSEAKRAGFDASAQSFDSMLPVIYDVANLAGFSDIGDLKSALEKPSGKYFERLMEENKKGGARSWAGNYGFYVLLKLILASADRLTPDFLESRGFNKRIAVRIVEVAKECRSS